MLLLSFVLTVIKVFLSGLILAVPTPPIEQVAKTVLICPIENNPYPGSQNILAVPCPAFKTESYEPDIPKYLVKPGTFPKISTSVVVIVLSLLAQTEKVSNGVTNVYPELDNVVLLTSLAIKLADDVLLIYKSNGPVLGAAPFCNTTTKVDPDGYGIV